MYQGYTECLFQTREAEQSLISIVDPHKATYPSS